jgi:WD40 repeat protein
MGATVWDAADGKLAQHLITNENARVAFSPNGRILAAVTSRECILWDVPSWQVRKRIHGEGRGGVPMHLAFSPDGQALAVTFTLNSIRLLDSESGTELATLTPPGSAKIEALAFSGDGNRLAAQAARQSVHLWDLERMHKELRAMGLDW